MKRIIPKLMLALGTMLFALALVEIGLRAMYYADRQRGGDLQSRLERSRKTSLTDANGEFNMTGLVQASPFKDIVYEAKPRLTGTFRGRGVRINSHGMRGPEIPVAKPADTYRIAVLGDSVAFGWGVEQDETYAAVLERRLNALPPPYPRYEAMNFALPGYNTAIEVATFEHRALPFGPDAVVLGFVGNDTGVPLFMERPQAAFSPTRSYLADLVRARMGGPPSDLIGNQMHELDKPDRKKVIAGYGYMVGDTGLRRALARLAALAKPRGIPVFIMKGSCSAKQSALLDAAAKEHGFVSYRLRNYTDDYVRTHGIPDNPQARRKLLNVSPTDDHPNAIGHEICAESILDQMAKSGIIRRPAAGAPAAQGQTAP